MKTIYFKNQWGVDNAIEDLHESFDDCVFFYTKLACECDPDDDMCDGYLVTLGDKILEKWIICPECAKSKEVRNE